MNKEEKKYAVMNQVANVRNFKKAYQSKFRVDGKLMHIRYCGRKSKNYPFNINPNTLKSDYEIWICADADHFYLIPTRIMQQIYDDPDAYIDKRHPEIRVVSLNPYDHNCLYARGAQRINFSEFFKATL